MPTTIPVALGTHHRPSRAEARIAMNNQDLKVVAALFGIGLLLAIVLTALVPIPTEFADLLLQMP